MRKITVAAAPGRVNTAMKEVQSRSVTSEARIFFNALISTYAIGMLGIMLFVPIFRPFLAPSIKTSVTIFFSVFAPDSPFSLPHVIPDIFRSAVSVQFLHRYEQNPFKIDFVDGIFASKLDFVQSAQQVRKPTEQLRSVFHKMQIQPYQIRPKILNATIIVKGMIRRHRQLEFPSEHVSANNAAPLPKKFTITAPPDGWNPAKILF